MPEFFLLEYRVAICLHNTVEVFLRYLRWRRRMKTIAGDIMLKNESFFFIEFFQVFLLKLQESLGGNMILFEPEFAGDAGP